MTTYVSHWNEIPCVYSVYFLWNISLSKVSKKISVRFQDLYEFFLNKTINDFHKQNNDSNNLIVQIREIYTI